MEHIDFPREIKNKFEIIQFLNNLLSAKENNLYYNMKDIKFFEASLIPFFHTINQQLFQTHEKIFYNEIDSEIENFFIKNKYLKSFNNKIKVSEDNYKTMLDFTILEKQENEEDTFGKIKNIILEKKLLNNSNLIYSYLLSNIGEITNNSYEHGDTAVAYICGQYYPRLSKLSFSISNLGKTINEKVKEVKPNLSNKKCIEWIFKEGTTTRKDGTSGGYGLYDLKEMVEELEGSITVISGYDYYSVDKSRKTVYNRLSNKYKGTTIIIDIYYKR